MTFTYSIQKVDFFSDQVEEKGAVDLDGAIEAFQKFSFKQQLKELNEREETSCRPSIYFNGDDKTTLGIWANDDTEFYLHYENETQESDVYVSNNFNQNPEGRSVEQYMLLFFEGKIEQVLTLTEKSSAKETIFETPAIEVKNDITINPYEITFAFNPWKQPISLIAALVFIALAIISALVLINGNDIDASAIIFIMLCFVGIPVLLLRYNYWKSNHNAQVIVNIKDKILTFKKDGQQIKFNRNEIDSCDIRFGRRGAARSGALYSGYDYLLIKLKDGRQIAISSFLAEPKAITETLKLNYTENSSFYPLLPKTILNAVK